MCFLNTLLWFITAFTVIWDSFLSAGFTDPAIILGLGFGPLHRTTNISNSYQHAKETGGFMPLFCNLKTTTWNMTSEKLLLFEKQPIQMVYQRMTLFLLWQQEMVLYFKKKQQNVFILTQLPLLQKMDPFMQVVAHYIQWTVLMILLANGTINSKQQLISNRILYLAWQDTCRSHTNCN